MKIPQSLLPTLMEESPSFRQFVASMLFNQEYVSIAEKVNSIVRCADGKIDAIKKVRVFFDENKRDFIAAFPNVEIDYNSNGVEYIGLGTAKRFVESIRNFD